MSPPLIARIGRAAVTYLYVLAVRLHGREVFGTLTEALTPASGRHTKGLFKVPCEMALIGETARRCHLGHRNACAQCLQRARDTHLVTPCMRRKSGFAREQARCVESREPHRLSQFGKRQRR